jgi:hypothetical protein
MKKIAVSSALSRLSRARVALERASNSAQDLTLFASAWSDFLLASNNVFSKLKEGSKGYNESERWFAQKISERKVDPLLRYLHHARNSDEHGLELTTSMQRRFETKSNDIFGRSSIVVAGENPQVTSSTHKVEPVGAAKAILISVLDRGVRYDPPETHLGEEIVCGDPIVAGNLMILFLQRMIEESKSLIS